MPPPFLFTREYMSKKCGNCGAPAPDNNSRFCDLCGSPLIEEQPAGFPVCPACGALVSDKKAQFCDVCGASLAKKVCPVCGTPAPAPHSKFCTRCGATYVTVIPGTRVAGAPALQAAAPVPQHSPAPAPVVVKLKKSRLPVPEDPSEEWDPWSDGDPTFDVQMTPPEEPPQKQYAHLPLVADEPERPAETVSYQESPLSMPTSRKKYSHLPLIADELKEDAKRRDGLNAMDSGRPAQSGKQGKKKGMFGFR